MSQKDFETRGMRFGKEVEAPIDVDTSQIADSVKAFAGSGAGMEEMEYYDEQEIVHRKGNSGVIPNLELLPTDSIRMPKISEDDLGMTKIMPGASASENGKTSDADSDDFDIDSFPEIEYESEDDPEENEEGIHAQRKPEAAYSGTEYDEEEYADGEYNEEEEYADDEYDEEEEYADGEYDEEEEYADDEYDEDEYADDEYDEEEEYDGEYGEDEYADEYDEEDEYDGYDDSEDELAKEERRKEKERKREQAKAEKKQRAEEREKAKEEKRQKAEEKEKAAEEKRQKAEEAEKAKEEKRKKSEEQNKEKAEKKQKAEEKAREEKNQKAEEHKQAKEERNRKAEDSKQAKEERKQKSEDGKHKEALKGGGKNHKRIPAAGAAASAAEAANGDDALIRADDALEDDLPLLPEDVEELQDLTYHNEDVKVPKKKKTDSHAAGGRSGNGDYNRKAGPNEKDGANKGKKKKGFGVADGLVIGGAVAAVIAIAVLGISLYLKNAPSSAISYTEAGRKLASIEGVGDAAITEIIANKTTTVVESDSEEKEVSSEKEKKVSEEISVNFSSVERDLKIKFSNKTTDVLITGVPFKIEAKTPDNKTVTWEDTDKDGMIYKDNLTPGTYYVRIQDAGEYKFPEKDTEVTVKDKVSYTAINVVNEIKKEKDVNVATEDAAPKIVDSGEKLQDTVAWVESTSKTVYTEVPKDKVTEPQASLSVWQSSLAAIPTLRGPHDYSALGDANNCVTNLTLSETSVTMIPGSTTIIIASVETNGDADMSISWSSSDSSVATVDGGEIKALKVGSATITCTTNGKDQDGNSISRTCEVTVVDAPKAVIGVTLNKTSVVLGIGSSDKLSATVEAGDGVDKSVSYSIADPNIATVSQDGTVTGKAVGTTTITCTTVSAKADGSPATATCSVMVQTTAGYVTSLTLDKPSASVAKGAKIKLTPTIQTDGTGADMTVTWSSSAANIATVSQDGTVTGVENGTAVITCTTNGKTSDGRVISATCTVTVKTASTDTTTNLTYIKDGEKKQLYVKDGDNYREAKYADYYKYSVFYIKEEILTGWQTVNGITRYYDATGKYVTGEQVIGGVKYNFANDGGIAMGSGTMGIDVSKWNGNINWSAVKNAGVSFVIIRCGYRGSTQGSLIEDSNFHTNASGAEANGIKVGVYFFSQAINEREAVEEASMAISMAQKHRVSYPIFIDIEFGNNTHTARADGLNKAQRTAVAKAFCETIRSSGYTPGVYSSKSWFYNQMDVAQLNQYKIWLAHYIAKTDYRNKFDLWQSSSTGRINGINGNVDIDTSYLGY